MKKKCCHCLIYRPIEKFKVDWRNPNYINHGCKVCAAEKYRQYAKENKEEIRRRQREWRLKNPDKVRATKLRTQAKHPERRKAQISVQTAVSRGFLPKIKTQPCGICGKKADHWHHHAGYARKNWLNVQAVCIRCHAQSHL